MKSSHLERLLGHVDDLDAQNLSILVQRLARERALLEMVFDTIQEGVLVIDRDGQIDYANQAALKLLGIQEKDVGKAILWRQVPNLAKTLNFDLESSALHMPVVSREHVLTYPEERIVRLYLVPFFAPDENQRFTVIMSDVTQDRVSTEAMIENEKLESIFLLAAGVAHELGNPLNTINIHLQLMKRALKSLPEGKSADQLRESIAICEGESQRLDGVIKHFLGAIRPSALELREVNLVAVLDEVLAVQAKELENRGIRVEISLSEALPIVMADKNQLKQVFFNLIKNAMEAMESHGVLTISSESDREHAYIKFSDTGLGMDQEDLGRVFEPYYSTKPSGHGLGMMIVQRIMRAHKAQVGIDSCKGKGTTVTLQFPLKFKQARMIEGDTV